MTPQCTSRQTAFRDLFLALLMAAVLVSCGGGPKPVADEVPKGQGASETGDQAKAEGEEDLTQRAEVKERVVHYVEGVAKEAQDSFREGLHAALKEPPDYDLARDKFEAAIAKDQAFLEAYTNLGKVYERERQPERALQVYKRAIKANPDNLDAPAYVGKIYLVNARIARDRGDTATFERLMQEAKAIFDTVVSRAPDNVAANNALALYWLTRGDPATAERHVVRVLANDPANTAALNTRGLLNLERGELRIARWIFAEKVLVLDPNSPEAHTNLGVTYVRLGNLPAAVVSFNKAIALDPENLPARMNLAAIQLNWLDYDSAAKQYAFVLDRQPDRVEALIGLGSARWGQRKFDQAVAAYDKARKLDPRQDELILRVAKIYESHLNRIDDAIATYQQYMKRKGLGPDSQLGRRIVALRQLQKMQEETPVEPGGGSEGESPEGSAGGDEGAGDASGSAETRPAPKVEPGAEAPKDAPEATPGGDEGAKDGSKRPAPSAAKPEDRPASDAETGNKG